MFTVVILGAGGVGKSALALRFVRDIFMDHVYDPTIEETYTRSLTVDGVISTLKVLDTAGTEQFVSINDIYYQAGDGFLLLFSLTNRHTLREVELVKQQLQQVKPSAPVIVVGNKLDLVNERQVSPEQMEELSSGWKVPVWATSAKRDWYVNVVFEELVRQMRERYPERPQERRRKRGHCILM